MEIITGKKTFKEKIKDKVHDIKEDAKFKVYQTADWMANNKEMAVVVLTVGGKLLHTTIKGVAKGVVAGRTANATKRRDLRCYDPSQGHYWELKRKLSANEWLRVNDRRKRGESLGDILSSMNVLK